MGGRLSWQDPRIHTNGRRAWCLSLSEPFAGGLLPPPGTHGFSWDFAQVLSGRCLLSKLGFFLGAEAKPPSPHPQAQSTVTATCGPFNEMSSVSSVCSTSATGQVPEATRMVRTRLRTLGSRGGNLAQGQEELTSPDHMETGVPSLAAEGAGRLLLRAREGLVFRHFLFSLFHSLRKETFSQSVWTCCGQSRGSSPEPRRQALILSLPEPPQLAPWSPQLSSRSSAFQSPLTQISRAPRLRFLECLGSASRRPPTCPPTAFFQLCRVPRPASVPEAPLGDSAELP